MAVTANQILTIKEPSGLLTVPVKSGQTIYSGTLAGVGKDGFLYNLATAVIPEITIIGLVSDDSINPTGPAATSAAGSISGGLEASSAVAGDKTVRNIWTKGFVKMTFTSITQAMLGTTMYATDNYTIDDVATGAIAVGYLATYISATSGYVCLNEFADSSSPGLRVIRGALVAATGTGAGAVIRIANPTGKTCMIERLILDVTTGATGGQTLDIGVAANGTTSADNLLDGVSPAAVTQYDNSVNHGTNGKGSKKWASTEFITATASAATVALAGTYVVQYRLFI
jgi:hypothetical protein